MVSENQLAGIAIGIGFAIEKKSFSNLEDPDGISITIPNAISIAIRCGYSFTYIALGDSLPTPWQTPAGWLVGE
jgi:hypothetical protein